ncbi:hypothetical protein SAMN06265348_116101 [Pedobacter westerhofensis]|uniref:Tissue inhibitor of metalloproteinase n=1 Tax=Pedobacter westerhofensis TaxID=425512 RepID=A0A521FSE4_9SPHI|nr:hypothetical protein [Pedobacter westerhofensis]SMO98411.1 hypothetical protein SAMN06265348_116101 [Pedobacter westerhofensis]
MKLLVSIFLLQILFFTTAHSQECKSTYNVSIKNSQTKEVLSRTTTVAFKSGWQMWLLTNDASYKTKANLTYIFAVVVLPTRNLVLRAFKGQGADLYWSGASPYANCDAIILLNNFPVTDIDGNKGIIKKASY